MVTINKQLNPKCIVIWLHGLGADCYDFLPFIEKFNKSEFEFILPNAPIIPITLNQGMKMRGWYDIHSLDFGFQDSEGLNSSKDYIEKIIAERVNGLTYSPKIIISGFSQGAALALYIGLTSSIKIDGVVSLSGYLPHINEDKLTNKKIPILAMHGNPGWRGAFSASRYDQGHDGCTDALQLERIKAAASRPSAAGSA